MGSGFFGGGCDSVSLLGTILPFYLTVINYKIFGKQDRFLQPIQESDRQKKNGILG